MKLTDLPGELLAACLARASGGDPAALLAVCAAHPALLRQFRPALGSLEHLSLNKSKLQRLGQFARAPGQATNQQALSHKLEHLLRALTSVKTLGLDFLRLKDEHLAAIGTLSKWTSLTLLDCSEVPDASLRHLCQLPGLEALDLSLTNRTCHADALQGMASLKRLYVRVCWQLPDNSLVPIAGNLRVLDVCCCLKLTDAICPLLTACEELDVQGTQITGKGLQLLAQHALELRRLTLSLTTNLTRADVDAFRLRRPEVEVTGFSE